MEFRPRALYAAFDLYPASKGAAVHIRHMAATLFDVAGSGLLYVLGDETLPRHQREDGVEILRFARSVPHFLDRTIAYGALLRAVLSEHDRSLELCHFRDPWGGIPVVTHPGRGYRTVFEVNGLPSIELASRHPGVSLPTLSKVRAAEQVCWAAADAIVTPSATIAANLVRFGAPSGRITVIPNGADVPASEPPRPAGAPERYFVYAGALQSWQGVDDLLRAFARLPDGLGVRLVICAAVRPREARPLQRLAERLEIADRVDWRFRLPAAEIAAWLAHAVASLAPLTECARNVDQGCCPLKVLESLAVKTPVIASDLPSVREIVTDGLHGHLVPPGRPAALGRAMRSALDCPDEMRTMGAAGRDLISADFTWGATCEKLTGLYRTLLE